MAVFGSWKNGSRGYTVQDGIDLFTSVGSYLSKFLDQSVRNI